MYMLKLNYRLVFLAFRTVDQQMSANRRASLVEWMVDLSETEFDIHLETLFLAVNILDRFLTTTPVAAECFNLLAVTSILVAAKMVKLACLCSWSVLEPHLCAISSVFFKHHS